MYNPVEDIYSLIPQRPPFVMIDRLLYCDETRTCSAFQVRPDTVFVHNGRLREPGMVENIAQTAAAGAGYISVMEHAPVAIGYIGSINNLKLFLLPQTGDALETEITVIHQVFNVTLISGKIRCKGTLLAECEMKIFITQTK